MVNHLVLNNLDAGAMRGLDQFLKFFERAKVLLNSVKVVRVVTVKRRYSVWRL